MHVPKIIRPGARATRFTAGDFSGAIALLAFFAVVMGDLPAATIAGGFLVLIRLCADDHDRAQGA